ncbi:hypothetical protein [Acinetobacter sp. AYS6]|uniref:hypothetical protein n=1 Tax=Acinetobacter sp. AYS6 TaxID=2983297 RepID=UPI003982FAAC
MAKLIKNSLLIILLGSSTGCSSMMENSISFSIKGQNKSYIYKNTWPECNNFKINPKLKYNDLSDSCKVSPEGYVPEKIVIEYTSWLTYEEQVKAGMGNSRTAFNLDNIPLGKQPPLETLLAYDKQNEKKIQLAIDKLPTSSWKQIVLYPPQEVAKYKNQLPEGKGDPKRGKEIHYNISLNPDGTYTITTKLYWKVPYQKNWN